MNIGRPYLGTFMLVFNQAMPHMVPAVMFGFARGVALVWREASPWQMVT
jgi:hypothetical protein